MLTLIISGGTEQTDQQMATLQADNEVLRERLAKIEEMLFKGGSKVIISEPGERMNRRV
jgi:hypothetical protein